MNGGNAKYIFYSKLPCVIIIWKLNVDNYITKYKTTNGINNVYLNMFGIEEVKAKRIDDFIDDEMIENINCIDTVL